MKFETKKQKKTLFNNNKIDLLQKLSSVCNQPFAVFKCKENCTVDYQSPNQSRCVPVKPQIVSPKHEAFPNKQLFGFLTLSRTLRFLLLCRLSGNNAKLICTYTNCQNKGTNSIAFFLLLSFRKNAALDLHSRLHNVKWIQNL